MGKVLLNQFKAKSIENQKIVQGFLFDRLKSLLRNENVAHDIISSMIDKRIQNQNDLLKIYRNTKTLSSFIGTKDGKSLKALWIRVSSILSIEEKKENNIPQEKITSFQEVMIAEEASVVDNLFVGSDSFWYKNLTQREKVLKAQELMEDLVGEYIDPYTQAFDLSLPSFVFSKNQGK